MNIGTSVPLPAYTIDPAFMARKAEELGFESLWYAEAGPLQMAAGTGGVPAVQFQPASMPMLRLESPWAPLVYVFVHYLVDGQAPGVPLPDGLLERAQAEGRLA